jgi:hypothetical protein
LRRFVPAPSLKLSNEWISDTRQRREPPQRLGHKPWTFVTERQNTGCIDEPLDGRKRNAPIFGEDPAVDSA